MLRPLARHGRLHDTPTSPINLRCCAGFALIDTGVPRTCWLAAQLLELAANNQPQWRSRGQCQLKGAGHRNNRSGFISAPSRQLSHTIVDKQPAPGDPADGAANAPHSLQ